jgi:hypothetical protein
VKVTILYKDGIKKGCRGLPLLSAEKGIENGTRTHSYRGDPRHCISIYSNISPIFSHGQAPSVERDLPCISQYNAVHAPRTREIRNMRSSHLKRYALHGFRTLEKFSYRVTCCMNAPELNDLVYITGQHFSIL